MKQRETVCKAKKILGQMRSQFLARNHRQSELRLQPKIAFHLQSGLYFGSDLRN